MKATAADDERRRRVRPISRSEADQLRLSRAALGQFLAAEFKVAFGADVEEVMFEVFPDGLYATMYVDGSAVVPYNVWAVAMASALGDAGVEVSVIVRSATDRLT